MKRFLSFVVLILLTQNMEARKRKPKGKQKPSLPVCKKADITELKNTMTSNLNELQNRLGSDITELETSFGSDIESLAGLVKDLKNSFESEISSLEEKLLTKLEDQQCCKRTDDMEENHDCSTVRSNSGKVVEIKTIFGKRFQAYCKQGWLSIARRFNGSVNFYRTWQDYERGFGDPSGEYFIGLENLADLLSQRSYRLHIELTSWENEVRYAVYSTFKVSGKSDKYRLTIGGYSGTASDSLSSHNRMAFSTKDMDNDIYSDNCAQKFTGAWWYNNCHESNLFGTYYPKADSPYAKGLTWRNWKGYHYSLKEMDMKVYPV